MPADGQDNIATQMRKGIVEFCFLLILSRRQAYPLEIIQELQEAGLSIKEATAYTILNRLKKDGKIDFQWKESTQGPPRKYFTITESGLQALQDVSREWLIISNTINSITRNNDRDS